MMAKKWRWFVIALAIYDTILLLYLLAWDFWFPNNPIPEVLVNLTNTLDTLFLFSALLPVTFILPIIITFVIAIKETTIWARIIYLVISLLFLVTMVYAFGLALGIGLSIAAHR